MSSSPETRSSSETVVSNVAEQSVGYEEENQKTVVVPVPISLEPLPAKALPQDDADANYLPSDRLMIVFISLCLALFVSSLDQTIVSVALPTIARQFDAVALMPWVGTSYLLTSTSFQPLYGSLSDIFGRRSTLIFCVSIFLVGSVLCGVATSMTFLIIARAVAGIGGGGIMSLVMIIISDIVPMRERGKYQGLTGGVFSLSSVIGPLLGGLLTDKASWRWAFYINLPFGLICIVSCIFFLRLKPVKGSWRNKIGSIDILGALSIITFVICILLPLEWGGSTYAWNSPIVISLFCVAVVFIAVAILVEGKVARRPIIPGRLFTYRNPTVAFILNFFLGMCFFGILYYIPVYFQTIWGESATIAGLETLPMIGGLVASSTFAGLLTSKLGITRPQIWIGLSLTTLSCGLMNLVKVDSSRSVTAPLLLIFGMGLGLTIQSVLLSAQAAVERRDLATVTSTASFTRAMGGVFGIAIAGSIFDNKLGVDLEPILAQLTPEQLQRYAINGSNFFRELGGPLLDQFLQAYMDGLHLVFTVMIPFAAIALLTSLFLEYKPLTARTVSEKTDSEPTPVVGDNAV